MQVALNAQLLSTTASYRGAGVSNYSRHLLLALGALAQETPDLALTAFVNVADFAADGVQMVRSRLPLQQPLARIAWEQSTLPLALRTAQADLVHGLVNVLPLATPVPGVVTVHDLSFVRLPEKLPRAKRWYLTQLCRASVQKARRVIAVSRQTADDLCEFFDLPAARISVIHNGVADHFAPQAPAAIAAFRQQHGLPERFLLYLGTLEPRKNLPLLIRAYAQWRKRATPTERAIPLILAGGKGWFYAEIFRLVQALDLTEMVRFPGFIPDAELPAWYSAAEVFIYPSLFEGFGLPVLEAMACGTPVICSAIASLCEVVGESALTFPAEDEHQLAALIGEAIRHAALRADLQQRGRQQAGQFSWHQTAAATAALYHKVGGK
jgi:glycosyltransferase involved in cell wall biosynthesis